MRAFALSFLFIASLVVARSHKTRCGEGLPPCTGNRCCSAEGFCGIGTDFCKQGCQTEYGRCRPTKPSTGPSTDPVPAPTPAPSPTPSPAPTPSPGRPPRPTSGAPAKVILACTVPGTVAITFDDGPAKTTHQLLDSLDRYSDVRVTFFINGNNYVDASLPEYQAVIARAYQSGHQIASHTLQHKDLATLGTQDIKDQMTKNDDIIYSATGRVPRYMRPPYGSVNDNALAVLGSLGFVVVNWKLDTLDWKTNDADKSTAAYQDYISSNKKLDFIALEHDTVASTATALMDMVIPLLRQHNLRMVTVAECLGDSRPYL